MAAVSGRTGSRRGRQHGRDDGLPGPRAGRFEETLGAPVQLLAEKKQIYFKEPVEERKRVARAWQIGDVGSTRGGFSLNRPQTGMHGYTTKSSGISLTMIGFCMYVGAHMSGGRHHANMCSFLNTLGYAESKTHKTEVGYGQR